MAGNPFFNAGAAPKGASSGGKGPSASAITRRLKNIKTAKADPDAKTDAAEKKSGKISKSDPDYATDMAGR